MFETWLQGSATCIDYKFGHQVALLASVVNLATKWYHLHLPVLWKVIYGFDEVMLGWAGESDGWLGQVGR